jgi:hypothetical protein
LQQRLQQCKAALQGGEQGVGGGSKQAAAALRQQLQKDAKQAAAAAEEAEKELQAAEEEVQKSVIHAHFWRCCAITVHVLLLCRCAACSALIILADSLP